MDFNTLFFTEAPKQVAWVATPAFLGNGVLATNKDVGAGRNGKVVLSFVGNSIGLYTCGMSCERGDETMTQVRRDPPW